METRAQKNGRTPFVRRALIIGLAAMGGPVRADSGVCAADVNATGTYRCSGDLPGGIHLSAPSAARLVIQNATVGTATVASPAVDLRNQAGLAQTLSAGEDGHTVTVSTGGERRAGIAVESHGTTVQTVNFFGFELPVGPGGSGGDVTVTSGAGVQTDGDRAHGITARSLAGAYPQSFIEYVNNTKSTDNSAYIVDSVAQLSGNVGHSVSGSRGGSFTLNSGGGYSYQLSGGDIETLKSGESLLTYVTYHVTVPNYTALDSDAILTLKVTRAADGSLSAVPEVFLDRYGSSNLAATTLRPDLATYYKSLSADFLVSGDGGEVSVTQLGRIETQGANSIGVFAESHGGRGLGGAGGVFTGDDGAPGGAGKRVTVINSGEIITRRAGSHGIVAHSIGGAGGNGGGSAIAGSGGDGGMGGVAGTVTVTNLGSITTDLPESVGILAQSLAGAGGGGGSGGALGGSGGTGGGTLKASKVEVHNDNRIATSGRDSYGVLAQSIGGFSGGGGGASGLVAIGGKGGYAGDGGEVEVSNSGTLTTQGERATAIVAQSIGGGGGNAGSVGGFVGFGGAGSSGGSGSVVTVTNTGTLSATGAGARAVYAQSVGGGGGDGGDSVGLFAIGGAGSVTSHGGAVTVNNSGSVTAASNAIFAQSVGGGGGNGGFSGGVVSIGGSGGGGGNGAPVSVSNSGDLTTREFNAAAIFAQSVGGGGGNGGGSVAVGAFGSLAIGGSGGGGGLGGTVTVHSDSGTIITGADATSGGSTKCNPPPDDETPPDRAACGDGGKGILAQSVGGGGGNAGFAVAASGGKGFSASVALGGTGGSGATSQAVEVYSQSNITTHGANAEALFAQSIGGGGGSGGFAVAVSASDGVALSVALGGNGGIGGDGNTVKLGSATDRIGGRIETFGNSSSGLLAQSVGGGGGTGGFSVAGSFGRFGVDFAMGGDGGGGGMAKAVTVDSAAAITTHGDHASAIEAQSIGGGGGKGGFSVTGSFTGGASSSGGLGVSLGGDGGTGSQADTVSISNTGRLETYGIRSAGVLAQSVGGGGGNGGFAGSVTLNFSGSEGKSVAVGAAIGGNGGDGGFAARTEVVNEGEIVTHGLDAAGIKAQSIGGGGGDGGFGLAVTFGKGQKAGNLGIALGGCAIQGVSAGQDCAGGAGGEVSVTNSARIETWGERSSGLSAKSLGGAGGDGGFAAAGSLGSAIPKACETGKTCNTKALDAQVSVSIGGFGGDGSHSSKVDVENTGTVITHGANAMGIRAESIGGGGGDGGLSLAGSLGGKGAKNIAVSIGGFGGPGGFAGNVEVNNNGVLHTWGAGASGIYAESVGGGGGDGGFAGTLAFSRSTDPDTNSGPNVNASFNLGGAGGDGAYGGSVSVKGKGGITTEEDNAHGVYAHSIGGGGGNGGSALQLVLGQEAKKNGTNVTVGVNIGGAGGQGSYGGAVTVERGDTTHGESGKAGIIVTHGDQAGGIVAQSVGHGGGMGGNANTLNLFAETKDSGTTLKLSTAIGGSGGDSGDGGVVTVDNVSAISTGGRQSPGIYAQSVGGGGGAGGNGSFGLGGLVDNKVADKFLEGLDVLNELVQLASHRKAFKSKAEGLDAAKEYGMEWEATVGGSGGASGDGKLVSVTNTGAITTLGDDSSAIFAQSIGGGGGQGGTAGAGLEGKISVAGGAGTSGDGGKVVVKQSGNVDTGSILIGGDTLHITGRRSHGIYAQSVGGGGGMSGTVDRMAKDWGLNIGLGISLGRDGGNSGNGGEIDVTYGGGTLTTLGEGASGIFAQSVGGGGGDVGDLCNNPLNLQNGGCSGIGADAGKAGDLGNNPLGISGNGGGAGDGGKVNVTIDRKGVLQTYGFEAHGVFAQSVGGGGGKAGGFWGSVGGNGGAHAVSVNLDGGEIHTYGDGAHGVLAQSRGGTGAKAAGDVTVTVKGDITASGLNADGIRAHSAGGGELELPEFDNFGHLLFHRFQIFAENNGVILVDVRSGTVSGSGRASNDNGKGGAGVRFLDGSTSTNTLPNTLRNHGTVTNASGVAGWAVIGGDGRDYIDNQGIITGSIDLAEGSNALDNKSGAALNAGAVITVGAGNVVSNAGSLAPGGSRVVHTTALVGNLLQTDSGVLNVDVDVRSRRADRLDVSGTALLGGTVKANLMNPGAVRPGTQRYTLLVADAGVALDELTLKAPRSAVTNYSLLYPSGNEVALQMSVDFRNHAANGNRATVGSYINAVQEAGGTPEFDALTAALLAIPDEAGLARAYDQLSPEAHAAHSAATLSANQGFNHAMLSCRVRDGEHRFSREGDCGWLRASTRRMDRERSAAAQGFQESAMGIEGGTQWSLSPGWHLGFGLSYEDSLLRIADGNARSDGERYQGGLIVKRGFGATLVSLAGSVARGMYRTERYLDIPVPGTTATGGQKDTITSAQLRAAHTFEYAAWYLRPMLDYEVNYTRLSSFQEHGAGAANLVMDASNHTYTSVRPGLEFGGEWSLRNGALARPFLQAGVLRYLSGTNPQITAMLEGAPAGVAPFSITAESDRTFVELVTGVDVINKEGTHLRFNYEGGFSRNTSRHTAGFKLAIPF